MANLPNITHKQWISWNPRKQFRGEGGLTVTDNISIFYRIKELMQTYPNELLLKHKHMMGEDFEDLSKSTAVQRQYLTGLLI